MLDQVDYLSQHKQSDLMCDRNLPCEWVDFLIVFRERVYLPIDLSISTPFNMNGRLDVECFVSIGRTFSLLRQRISEYHCFMYHLQGILLFHTIFGLFSLKNGKMSSFLGNMPSSIIC